MRLDRVFTVLDQCGVAGIDEGKDFAKVRAKVEVVDEVGGTLGGFRAGRGYRGREGRLRGVPEQSVGSGVVRDE